MKLMIIGLDGLSPVLIDQWVDLLPNLRHMRDQGTYGTLTSIVPPSSVPAWQCFATGKNPAKIGVWGFLSIGPDRKIRHGRTTENIGCIWDIASKAGYRVGVFNVPGTYPPYPVNGFMVSGFPTPPGKTWAYPKHLMKQLDRAVDGYEIDVPLTKPSDMKGGETAYLEQVERLHSKCVQAGKYLLEQYHPDLFMMTLQGVDMVQHDFSRYMVEPDSEYTNVIKDWYIRLDEAVGEFRKHASSETYVLTLSDHGSVPIATSFHVNEFLKKQGILVLKEPSKTTGKKKKNRDLYTPLRNMLLKNMSPNTIRTLYRVTPDFIAHKLTLSAQHERTLTRLVNSIDWNHTQAFSTGGPQAAFYVNSQEYDHGLFKDPAKRMEFIQKLKILLDNLKHPLTGEKITAIFHHRENTFKGPFELEAPDLCVELFGRNEKIHINITLGQDHEWSFSPHLSSEHVREGFWSITGPEVPAENHLDANILDLAPTLETMLHLQVDRDTDGAVIVSLLGGSHKSEIPLVTVVR